MALIEVDFASGGGGVSVYSQGESPIQNQTQRHGTDGWMSVSFSLTNLTPNKEYYLSFSYSPNIASFNEDAVTTSNGTLKEIANGYEYIFIPNSATATINNYSNMTATGTEKSVILNLYDIVDTTSSFTDKNIYNVGSRLIALDK